MAGYEDVPTWIVQGYTTMLFEALDQLRDKGYDRPSHVFLQAGVGAMAGGVLGALQSVYGHGAALASPLWSRTMWPAFTSLSSSRTVRHILPPGTI